MRIISSQSYHDRVPSPQNATVYIILDRALHAWDCPRSRDPWSLIRSVREICRTGNRVSANYFSLSEQLCLLSDLQCSPRQQGRGRKMYVRNCVSPKIDYCLYCMLCIFIKRTCCTHAVPSCVCWGHCYTLSQATPRKVHENMRL